MYAGDLFNADGQFRTLQELSCTLEQRANWMCEFGMVGNAMCKESLEFNVECCQCIRKVFTGDFLFNNGLHYVGGRRCKFFCGGLLCRGFEPPCRRAVFGGLFSVGGGCWSDMYGERVGDVFDKRVCEFGADC